MENGYKIETNYTSHDTKDIENVLGDLSFEMSNFNSDQKDNSVYWALSHSYDIITGLREAIKPEVVEWLRD